MESEKSPKLEQEATLTSGRVTLEIAELANGRKINRDQERIGTQALTNPDFALLANRAMNRGTDPELLKRTVPESVYAVAKTFGLSPEQADSAITTAHQRGPGSLAKDSPEEWLWLILAKYSMDESKHSEDPAKVLAASARMIVGFEQYAMRSPDPLPDAKAYREDILAKTQPIGSAPLGKEIPLYDSDLGFYAAYRTDHPVAAVKGDDGLVFYGTDGSVTLEQAGIKPDKLLSPLFGIVFPEKTP